MADPMPSLVRAYLMAGGDPAALIKYIETPVLPEEEATFFKKFEDQMRGFNGV
jgi:hypothetical protein